MAAPADEVIVLPLTGHCTCGQDWDGVNVKDLAARQVHDLPELVLQVTEYRAEIKVCPGCRRRQHAPFPDHVPGQVQYGPACIAGE